MCMHIFTHACPCMHVCMYTNMHAPLTWIADDPARAAKDCVAK